ncbi:hypothetical protein K490DRAFT_12868, partial [Saccharata proteae CBS 121410]
PSSIYYIPNFLTPTEEAQILQKLPPHRWIPLTHRRLQAHPTPLHPRTHALLSAPLPAYLATSPAPILARFAALDVFARTPHAAPNHCLVNEYAPGQGIMPHEDGAAYAAVTATVSLGGGVVLELWGKGRGLGEGGEGEGRDGREDEGQDQDNDDDRQRRRQRPRWRILQEPRSLLVTTGAAYTDLLHGIAEVEVDEGLGPQTVANWDLLGEPDRYAGGRNERGLRVSLTYRDVLKVSKVSVFGLGRR